MMAGVRFKSIAKGSPGPAAYLRGLPSKTKGCSDSTDSTETAGSTPLRDDSSRLDR